MKRQELEFYLSRAVTMQGIASDINNDLGNVIGKADSFPKEAIRQEHIEFINRTGAKFIGRAAGIWSEWQNNSRFYWAYKFNEEVRKYDPTKTEIYPLEGIILQAAIFEYISQEMLPWNLPEEYNDSMIKIPTWVFEEFGVAVEERTFNADSMAFKDKTKIDNGYVPDITQQETQMWFFYRAVMYMTLGYEAIHFGQMELMTDQHQEPAVAQLWSLLSRIRRVAKEGIPDGVGGFKKIALYDPATNEFTITLPIAGARRGWVLCDAHTYGMKYKENLVFDFHSFPLSLQVGEKYPDMSLEKRTYNSDFGIIRRSLGGKTYFGWECSSLPYLVEVDNFGMPDWRWSSAIINDWFPTGCDHITWWGYILNKQQRDTYISYFHHRLRFLDKNGFFQPPAVRGHSLPYRKDNYPAVYFAHAYLTANYAYGNQEEILKSFFCHEFQHWYLDKPLASHNWYPKPIRNIIADTVGKIFYTDASHQMCCLGSYGTNSWYANVLDWNFPADVGDSVALSEAIGTLFYKGTDSHLHRIYWQNNSWHHQALLANAPISGGILASNNGYCFYIDNNKEFYVTELNGGVAQIHKMHALVGTSYAIKTLICYDDTHKYLLALTGTDSLLLYINTGSITNWVCVELNILQNATQYAIISMQGNISYRSTDNRLYECVLTGNMWETTEIDVANLSNVAGGLIHIPANDDIIYVGTDNRLWRAYKNVNGWHRDALDWSAPANVVDNVVIDANSNLYYKGTDKRIHCYQWSVRLKKWQYEVILNWRTEGIDDLQADNVAHHLVVNRIENEVFYTDIDGNFCRIIKSDGFNF